MNAMHCRHGNVDGIVLGACRQGTSAYERIGQYNRGFRNRQYINSFQRFESPRRCLLVAPYPLPR